MKRNLLAAILGLGLVITAGSAYGTGHIYIWNYALEPYNQVVFASGEAVQNPNVEIQVWYGKGSITNPEILTPGPTTQIYPGFSYDPGHGFGGGGYFYPALLLLPDWQRGDTYTIQLRGYFSGALLGSSSLWQEDSDISEPPALTLYSRNVPVLVLVPEPGTFALAMAGLVSLLPRMARRR